MRSESPSAGGGRLHPTSLLFRILGHGKTLLLPAVAVVVFARGESWQAWLGLLFVPFVLYDVFQYATLRWRYEEEELVVTQGWLFRSVRHVPYARIQNLDLRQNVAHRLLNVTEVRIETAGGAEPEAVLRVISLAQYEELRARAFAGRAALGASPPGAPDAAAAAGSTGTQRDTLLELGLGDLVLLALNPGRGLALLAIGWGLAKEFELLDRAELSERIEAWTEGLRSPLLPALWLLLLLAAVGAVALLSLTGTLLAFHGFRLEADGDVFRIHSGLLTREVKTIPRRRIQVITVKQSVLHRLAGRARILVRTAGSDSTSERDKSESGAHFAPIVAVERVPDFLRRIRPDLDLDECPWRGLGRTAPRRILVAHLVRALPLAIVLVVAFEITGAVLAVGVAALALALARAAARRAAWTRAGSWFGARRGALALETSVTFVEKVQTLSLQESPFDRRHGHATLAIDTAGGFFRGTEPVRVDYLPRAQAAELRDELVAAAAGSHFRW